MAYKKINVRIISTVGISLALCLVAQMFKGIQFITGPLINTIIIITGLYVGLGAGIIVAILSPIMAYIFAPVPLMQALPQMIIVIMLGNATIVLISYLFRKNLLIGLPIAALAKAVIMWVLSSFVVLPIFGAGLKAPMINSIRVTFSLNQLITAAIGAIIVFPVWNLIKKIQIKNK